MAWIKNPKTPLKIVTIKQFLYLIMFCLVLFLLGLFTFENTGLMLTWYSINLLLFLYAIFGLLAKLFIFPLRLAKKTGQILMADRIALSIKISNPDRSEFLEAKAGKYLDKLSKPTRRQQIEASLKSLGDEDFVIFSSEEHPDYFIQFIKDDIKLMCDYPFSVIDERSKLVDRLIYVLRHLKFNHHLSLANKVDNVWIKYYRYQKTDYGVSAEAYCGMNTKLGADLTLAIFKDVYQLTGDFSMITEFNSFQKFWI
jgi:hypothetical protein